MPVITIAEIGINHNGDLKIAKKLIDMACSAGCDYVKFQKRDIDLVYSKEELDKPRESSWGTTTREQKAGLEFSDEEYGDLFRYCDDRIGMLISPWDENSLHYVGTNCEFIKIPSALTTNVGFLEKCIRYNKKVILSTGMCTIDMVDSAVTILGKENIHSILHCTSTYPSKPEELNLNCIPMMKERYRGVKIGFSNHNPGIIYMPIACAMGAEVVEFHITLDRSMYGSDQASSIEPEGVFKLIKYIRGVDKAMGDGTKRIYDSELPIIGKLRR